MKAEELLRKYASGERDFSGLYLQGINLVKANLERANFRGTNLAGFNLGNTILIAVNFKGATRFGELWWDDWTMPICDAYINYIILPDGTQDTIVRVQGC